MNVKDLGQRTRKRPNRREIAAAATRQEILSAARRLFFDRGYLQTSISQIAEEAGVSIPTIYASVGPKTAIVLALGETIDSDVGGPQSRERLRSETNAAELLRMAAGVTRQIQERFGDIIAALLQAAAVEPEIAKGIEKGRDFHRAATRLVAGRLHELGALRPGVSSDEAADVIALLTEVSTYARLVGDYGWSFDRAEAWISDTLMRLLLPDT